jgi:hypothetical protein
VLSRLHTDEFYTLLFSLQIYIALFNTQKSEVKRFLFITQNDLFKLVLNKNLEYKKNALKFSERLAI